MKINGRSGSNDEHSLLSPSGSKRWLGCSASLLCEADIPNKSGVSAVTGTACHTIAEKHLNCYIAGNDLPVERDLGAYVLDEGKGSIKALVKPVKGAVLITDDMIKQVKGYTEYCKPIIDAAAYAKLEMRVNLSEVLHPGYKALVPSESGGEPDHEGDVETFGTADLVAVLPIANTDEFMLIVGDLKTGRHKVDAKENKQLMLYALGILRRLRRRYNITTVRLAIYQQLAGGASEWDISVEGLEIFAKYASKRAIDALDVYHGGKKNLKPSHFKPSADACQWCRFAEQCSAKAKSAGSLMGDDAPTGNSIEMTPEQLKAEWDKLPELRQHIATIEKAVYAAMQSGKRVPGLKLVEGKMGNRTWDDVGNVADLLRTREEEKAMYKEVMLSPTEAEKAVKVMLPELWERIEPRITRKPGAPVIADADDKRPEWSNVTEADLE